MIEMVAYIKEHVKSKEKPQYVSNLLQSFKQLYIAKGGKPQDAESYSVQHFTTKLKKEFNQNGIAVKANRTKKTVILKNESMPLTHATHLAKQSQNLEANIIWKCATKLRNNILSLEFVPVAGPICVNSIIKGEKDPPESVQNFFSKVLYTGSAFLTFS